MGFDAMFFGRMDAEELGERIHNKEMEWIQRPASQSLGNEVGILFHVMNDVYNSPGGFCFDITCGDPTFQTDPTMYDTYDADREAEILDGYFTDLQGNFVEAGSDLFQVFGMDFRMMDAWKNYRNLDSMIEYMNKKYPEKWHLQYATPSNYIDAIAAMNRTWPIKTDDLFPYQSSPSCYWTGYFSSRANNKAQVRQGSSNLHAANSIYKTLLLDKNLDQELADQILAAKSNMLDQLGIYQHHDAVSGTAKQAVTNDYSARLSEAMAQNNKAQSSAFNFLIGQPSNFTNWELCERTNGTYLDCPISHYNLTEGSQVVLSIHNPSYLVATTAKIALPHPHFTVEW